MREQASKGGCMAKLEGQQRTPGHSRQPRLLMQPTCSCIASQLQPLRTRDNNHCTSTKSSFPSFPRNLRSRACRVGQSACNDWRVGKQRERRRRPVGNVFMRSGRPQPIKLVVGPPRPRPCCQSQAQSSPVRARESVSAAWRLQAHLGRLPFLLSFLQQDLHSLAVPWAAWAVRNSPASTVQFGRLCPQFLAPLHPPRAPFAALKRDGGSHSSPATAAQAAGWCPSSSGASRYGCPGPGAQYQHEAAYG